MRIKRNDAQNFAAKLFTWVERANAEYVGATESVLWLVGRSGDMATAREKRKR